MNWNSKQNGYDDATCGRSIYCYYPEYLEGYKEGLEAQIKFAKEELKKFNKEFGPILDQNKPNNGG